MVPSVSHMCGQQLECSCASSTRLNIIACRVQAKSTIECVFWFLRDHPTHPTVEVLQRYSRQQAPLRELLCSHIPGQTARTKPEGMPRGRQQTGRGTPSNPQLLIMLGTSFPIKSITCKDYPINTTYCLRLCKHSS